MIVRRPLVLLLVVLAHGGALAALAAGQHEDDPAARVTAPVLVAHLIREDEVAAPVPVAEPPPPVVPRPQPVRPVARPRVKSPATVVALTSAVTAAAAADQTQPASVATDVSAAPAPSALALPPPLREPTAISCVTPAYPAAARRRGEAGAVLLRLLIDADGRVIERELLRSSGFSMLDEAAVTALAKCRFQPGTLDGRPQAAWVRLRYVWKLE